MAKNAVVRQREVNEKMPNRHGLERIISLGTIYLASQALPDRIGQIGWSGFVSSAAKDMPDHHSTPRFFIRIPDEESARRHFDNSRWSEKRVAVIAAARTSWAERVG